VSRITHKHGDGRRPNMGDALEVVNFWCWSGSACGLRIAFLFFSPLRNGGHF